MSSAYRFYNPVRIYFGRGARRHLIKYVISKKCLVVCSRRGAKRLSNDPILHSICGNEDNIFLDDVLANPTLNEIQKQTNKLKKKNFDAIVAFGGGSVIDSAKAISVIHNISAQKISIKNLINSSTQLNSVKPLPLFALPTTSGTGSEMTSFATFWDQQNKKKHSLDHESLFPFASFIDPDLTNELPLNITLSTGLDAINQACESIWNVNATPHTLDISFRALELGLRSLPLIMNKKINKIHNAREDLAESSMLAGIAISHTRTGVCHSISYPITSHFNVPHGIACAFTMRQILKINLKNDDGRFKTLAKRLLGAKKSAKDLIVFFDKFFDDLNVVPIFKSYIDDINEIKALKHKMITKARFKNNLVKLTISDLDNILEKSLNPLA
jgi:alcohol dehydrogenase